MTDQHDCADAQRLAQALSAIRALRARVHDLERDRAQPIAIIGMGCRFPSAPDPPAYWRLLRDGRDAIGDIPADRWDVSAYYDPDPQAPGRMYCRRGGFLDDVAGFDAAFFGISPREAKRLDPQQRLLLEVSWEALEDSGRDPRSLHGSRSGVFVGISEAEYLRLMQHQGGHRVEMHDVTGTALSLASGRLSYHLGLQGPSLALDTACSSALVAVHLAVASLRSGESDLALAGAVSLMLVPEVFVAFCKGGALAADGRCKTFDASADGYGRGEGAGVVVLKRLRDALADGDPIHAVILGTAVNQDGRTNGLTAPSGLAQQDCIRQALADAGIEPAAVGYVETHGTGTALGDPIEVAALGAVFSARGPAGPLVIGAVKTNIGHLETAAGIAGLIKTVLSLRHRQIPPSLNFRRPNPHIPWSQLPVMVPRELLPWPEGASAAGVSSFGFSGTNAHVVLAAAPPRELAGPGAERPRHILPLSARTPQALRDLAACHTSALREQPETPFADVCYTVGTGRSVFPHRLAVPAASSVEAAELLSVFADGRRAGVSAGVSAGQAQDPPRTAFLFTGQGSQYAGMGRLLQESHPGFRRDLERCEEILRDHGYLDAPLLQVLYPEPGGPADGLIERTSHAQPGIFALEYALARLWLSWGVQPHVVLGHSTGEYAAASVAGVFGLEDGLTLIALRARLIEEATSGGATAAVFATPEEIVPTLDSFAGQVSMAGFNSPRETLIAGDAAAVMQALAALKALGVDGRPLRIPHAPHSPLIEPVLAEFEAAAARVDFAAPRVRMISNVTGSLIDVADATYWRRQLREPVRFSAGMTALAAQGCAVVLEIGPQPVLQLLGRQNWRGPAVRWLSCLWEGHDDWKQLLHSLGQLYAAGAHIDWAAFDREYPRRKISAPSYPFQRAPYWFTQEEGTMVPPQAPTPAGETASRDRILTDLRERISASLEMSPQDIEPGTSFIDLGADSLLLMRLIQDITDQYAVTLTVGQFFDELDTLEAVATHLSGLQSSGDAPPAGRPGPRPAAQPGRAGAPPSASGLPSSGLTAAAGYENALGQLMEAQLEIMSRQLDILARHGAGGAAAPPEAAVATGPVPVATGPVPVATGPVPVATGPVPVASRPGRAAKPTAAPDAPTVLTDRQRRHLDELLDRHKKRTAGSLGRAVRYRASRADTRMRSVRPETRPVSYPIIGERADGAHFWDIDGNEYVDIAGGVGVLLCGHNPEFVTEAVSGQLKLGLQTGPICALADEVAALLCELTGMERMFFAVTGTDAVRGALRVAQAVTGRSRFVMFSGSYHGQDDRVLAVPDVLGDPRQSVPMALGISPQAAGDPLILAYGSASSLAVIEAHADELAGVLVEPVQSRNPGLQPAEFLRDLRALTTRLGIALIFDEVLTGFRVHPGGAQAHFGVRADIAAYGKVIGGGQPVAAVAGKAGYLDRVDGGTWADGPGPDPDSEKTYIGSTFEMHPLAMASARAMLRHLRDRGPALQQELNARTTYLADTLNAFFEAEDVPIRLLHFSSVFRFAWKGNTSYAYQPLAIEVFHFHLITRGIYIWEGRTCFLSTAHTEQDIRTLIEAAKQSVAAMRDGGFLPAADDAVPLPAPVSAEQRALLALEQHTDPGAPSWVVAEDILLRGPLDLAALRRAVAALTWRHEALRTVFPAAGEALIQPQADVPFGLADFAIVKGKRQARAVTVWWEAALAQPFDLAKGPLLRAGVLRLGDELHHLALLAHHIIADGWSMTVLVQELAALYTAERRGVPAALGEPSQHRDFVAWQNGRRDQLAAQRQYWSGLFRDGYPDTLLPADRDRPARPLNRGARVTTALRPDLCQAIKQTGRAHKATLFMTLLAVYGLLIHRLTGQDDILIGTPQAGRTLRGSDCVVGYCAHFLPVRSRLLAGTTVADYLRQVREWVLAAVAHQEVPFAALREDAGTTDDPADFPLPLRVVFNLDRGVQCPEFDGLTGEFQPVPAQFALVDLRLDGVESHGGVRLDCDYRTDLFDEATIRRWCAYYRTLLEELVRDPGQPIARLPAPPQLVTTGRAS